jgi:hypothetical protein
VWISWPDVSTSHRLIPQDQQTAIDALQGKANHDHVEDMAYRLGVQTTALQSMFHTPREEMPPPDKILDRLSELANDQRQMQQELRELRTGPNIDISLERLRSVIENNRLPILQLAHPAAIFVRDSMNVLTYRDGNAEIIDNVLWKSMTGKGYNTVFHYLVLYGNKDEPKVTALSIEARDIGDFSLPPFAATNLIKPVMIAYFTRTLATQGKELPFTMGALITKLPVELVLSNLLMYVANTPGNALIESAIHCLGSPAATTRIKTGDNRASPSRVSGVLRLG